MKRIEKLPSAFIRYEKMSGVVDFAVFEDAIGSEEKVFSAITQTLHHSHEFNTDMLRSLGSRRIRERAFFGDWYDLDSRRLLKIGSWRTADGSELEHPELEKLEGVKITPGAAPSPQAGVGGQFAYAFSRPPYGLKGRPSEVQAVSEEIRDFLLPPGQRSETCDWSSPQLPEVSDYFIAGMEWWGVFLFSIYIAEIERLSIVTDSTTD